MTFPPPADADCPYPVGTIIYVKGVLVNTAAVVAPGCMRLDAPFATYFWLADAYAFEPWREVSQAEFDGIKQGPDLPDVTNSNGTDHVDKALEPIYGGALCRQHFLRAGTLIEDEESGRVSVIAPGCLRRHVPNPQTLQQLQQLHQTFGPTEGQPPYDQITLGPDIPDSATYPAAFDEAMKEIYGASAQAVGSKPPVDAADASATLTAVTTPTALPQATVPTADANATPTSVPTEVGPTPEPTLTPLSPADAS